MKNFDDILTKEEKEFRDEFIRKFSPDALQQISIEELPAKLFGNKEDNSMIHNVEFNGGLFGGVKATKSTTNPIFRKKNELSWKKGNKYITEEEVRKICADIKNTVIQIDKCIDNKDFEQLYNLLYKNEYFRNSKMHKYLCILYPKYFFWWHALDKRDEISKDLNPTGQSSYDLEKYFWDKYKEKINDLNMKKIPSEYNLLEKLENNKQRYWLYAAGEKSKFWDEFYSDGIMAIGWDGIDNLSNSTKEEINERVNEFYKNEKDKSKEHYTNTLWNFYNKIKKGDIIYVKNGLYKIYGRGIVDSEYYYNKNRKEFKHCRNVKWTNKCEYNIQQQLTQHTLTDITNKKDLCENLECLFNKNNQNSNKKTKQPLNQILYGPPGTGKTYNTIIKAMEIIDKSIIKYDDKSGEVSNYEKIKEEFDNCRKNHQIEFITFHQSYSYEEFVEGIKPVINSENEDNLKYEHNSGIFKRIAKNALFDCLNITDEIKNEKTEFENILNEFRKSNKIGTELSTISDGTKFIIKDYTDSSIRIMPKDGISIYSITFSVLQEAYDKLRNYNEITNNVFISEMNYGLMSKIGGN